MTIITIDNSKHTSKLVRKIKEQDEDFEWYPTTQEIVDIITNDLNTLYSVRYECYRDESEPSYHRSMSVLDCGAGDGRVLSALTNGKKYAIEKSTILQQEIDKSIFLIGTDFEQQTLVDKKVDVIFSNPPYKLWDLWSEKIIREANAQYAYLVIPHRWVMNEKFDLAVKDRCASVESLGIVDFYGADRKARAIVDVLRITFIDNKRSYYSSRNQECNVDPFKLWFDNEFSFEAKESKLSSKYHHIKAQAESIKDKVHALTERKGLVKLLEDTYNCQMTELLTTYKMLNGIDGDILKELGVNREAVREGLQLKIESKKEVYWKELFHNLSEITDKLTTKSRERLLESMQSNMSIDFTSSNAYAVCLWVLKNANQYYDDQVIEVVESLYSKDNMINYVSNKRTLCDDAWRYNNPDNHSHYKLDYRIVAHRLGGIGCSDSWSYSKHTCGLQARTVDAINDLIVVASNLGFIQDSDCPRAEDFQWSSGQMKTFLYKDLSTGKTETLFTCRAYMNGNLHFKVCQEFMKKMNIEFGRLKGWIRSAKEASKELDIPLEEVEAMYNCNLQLTASNLPVLGFTA
ncbi:DUF4942 domain-containing protein [Photobacterium damselae]|uniref:DUF4942 domain-containing protein n=1 Tax=Photobacterium damselae TaxID=38293 RepID=UPI0040693D11